MAHRNPVEQRWTELQSFVGAQGSRMPRPWPAFSRSGIDSRYTVFAATSIQLMTTYHRRLARPLMGNQSIVKTHGRYACVGLNPTLD